MKYDNVNNPKHYALANKHLVLEPIDICEKYSFCQGNAIKYLLRYENKNGVEDLKKALWYLNRIINESLKICYPDGGLDKILIKQYEKSHPIAYMVMNGYVNNAKNAVEEAIAKAAEPLDKAVKTKLNKKKTLPDAWFSFLEMLDSISKLLDRGNTQIKFDSYLKTLHAYDGSLPDDKFLEYVTYLITTANDLILDNISDFLDSIQGLKVVTFFKTLTAEEILQVIKEYNED
uniref:Nucelotide kinase n=1 Tax=Podoviridae sp. ctIKM86 TaxID=2827729 RepID=A0A8S5SMV1_9CAUD|nr:MAG TPA: nucelotide kinase [Podoviridae sp. ctIKM86]